MSESIILHLTSPNIPVVPRIVITPDIARQIVALGQPTWQDKPAQPDADEAQYCIDLLHNGGYRGTATTRLAQIVATLRSRVAELDDALNQARTDYNYISNHRDSHSVCRREAEELRARVAELEGKLAEATKNLHGWVEEHRKAISERDQVLAELAAERERAEKAERESDHNFNAGAAAHAEADRLARLLREASQWLHVPESGLVANPTDHQAPASGALVHPVVGRTESQETTP